MNIIKTILISTSIIAFTACGGGGQTGNSNTGSGSHSQNNNDNAGSGDNSPNQSNSNSVRLKKHTSKVDDTTTRSVEYIYDGDFLVKSINKQEPIYNDVTEEQIVEFKHFTNGKSLQRATWSEMNDTSYSYVDSTDKNIKRNNYIKREHTSKNTAKVESIMTVYAKNGEISKRNKEVTNYLFKDDKYQKIKESNSTLYSDKGEIIRERKTEYTYITKDDGDELEKDKVYEKKDAQWVKILDRSTTSKWISENIFAIKEISGTVNINGQKSTTTSKYEFDGKYDKFHPSPMGSTYLGLGNTKMIAYKRRIDILITNGDKVSNTFNFNNSYNENNFLKKSEYSNANKYENIYEYY